MESEQLTGRSPAIVFMLNLSHRLLLPWTWTSNDYLPVVSAFWLVVFVHELVIAVVFNDVDDIVLLQLRFLLGVGLVLVL